MVLKMNSAKVNKFKTKTLGIHFLVIVIFAKKNRHAVFDLPIFLPFSFFNFHIALPFVVLVFRFCLFPGLSCIWLPEKSSQG